MKGIFLGAILMFITVVAGIVALDLMQVGRMFEAFLLTGITLFSVITITVYLALVSDNKTKEE